MKGHPSTELHSMAETVGGHVILCEQVIDVSCACCASTFSSTCISYFYIQSKEDATRQCVADRKT